MDNLLEYLDYDLTELILLGVFAIAFTIEIFFCLYYYKALLRFSKKQPESEQTHVNPQPSVSVIIVSSNEVEHLEKTLPQILEQDYPDFEVIVVNNGSTDETEMLVKSLQNSHSNLYGTYLPMSRDKIFGRKKLAMTIGIKAAKNDILLFTEPYCRPVSNNWITRMVEKINGPVSNVAGHSIFYEKPATYSTRRTAFDNLEYCHQYMSMIIRKKPFSATFRNLAMRKNEFFEHKGFASVLNYEDGEELFLNRFLTGENTILEIHPDAFVESVLDESENYIWKGYRTEFLKIKSHFKGFSWKIFGLDAWMKTLLILIWSGLLLKSILEFHFVVLSVATLLGIFLFIFQMLTANQTARLLRSGKFILSWPLLVLTQPLRNFYLRRRKNKTRQTIGNF